MILVAEDEKSLRELILRALSFNGFQVASAADGREAVQKVKDLTPDLVILDVGMPIMNGYEACQLIKSDPNTQNVPIIFLSARGKVDDIQYGLDLGADEYLVKPFNLSQLGGQVIKVLQKYGKV
ncbi:MAG TPA: response regulator [Anaerolineae bacterium]|nr:response regulator [Anaerolineae bacterium]HMR66828.1 response regulator [Anaerolineae bacterium]